MEGWSDMKHEANETFVFTNVSQRTINEKTMSISFMINNVSYFLGVSNKEDDGLYRPKTVHQTHFLSFCM